MFWLSCQPKLVAQRISSDVPNGLVPLNQRPPSAVPQRSAVGCLGRESVVATVHARCVGPWDPFGCLLGSVNSIIRCLRESSRLRLLIWNPGLSSLPLYISRRSFVLPRTHRPGAAQLTWTAPGSVVRQSARGGERPYSPDFHPSKGPRPRRCAPRTRRCGAPDEAPAESTAEARAAAWARSDGAS